MSVGRIVELVSLEKQCPYCLKKWEGHREMIKDPAVESDMDYNELIYFHQCKRTK